MIYLDNNATTSIAPAVYEAMVPFLTGHFANPSSAYLPADECRRMIKSARADVAALLGAADETEIVFTSGGTESDNWAILGTLEARPDKTKVITTRVEHEAVRKVCEKLALRGYEICWLDVNADGTLDPDELRAALDENTALVSIMTANNETGVVFPVAELAELVKSESGAAFHTDAVNAAGKIPIDLKNTRIDLLSISGHKFHGPKGAGALYVRDGFDIASNSIGGGQENGRRAGTEAIHQIAGLGAAARLASNLEPLEEIRFLRDRLENQILTAIPQASVNGHRDSRLPNTSNIAFEGFNGEMILSKLDESGVCVSTGSACNETSHVSSPVLRAMEVPYAKALGSIRFSLGRGNTAEEIDFVAEKVSSIVEGLRRLGG